MPEETKDYGKYYSEESFFEKLKKFAKNAGVKVVYAGLLLYYVFQKPEVPVKVKTTILGALGYFIFPFDLIPDFAPIVGYGDDLGALALALGTAAFYIDSDVREKARKKLNDWFSSVDEEEIKEIDEKY